MKVLMVCTGNICRSPMAEAMLRHELQRRGCEGVEVSSAGTWAGFGNPAQPEALEVLRARGIDHEAHRSRPVDPRELEDTDVIVAMTSVHLRELRQLADQVDAKLVLMKELAEIEVAEHSPSDAAERVRALLGGNRPTSRRALDLDDPMGLPVFAYERAADEIAVGVARLVEVLCGPEPVDEAL